MDDQWSVLQSEDKTARSSTAHPLCPLASGPKRVPNLLGALLFSMSETGRKCFQFGSQQSTPSQIALGLRNSAALGLAEANHVRFAFGKSVCWPSALRSSSKRRTSPRHRPCICRRLNKRADYCTSNGMLGVGRLMDNSTFFFLQIMTATNVVFYQSRYL
jgi:hypothetical protein